MGSLPFVESFVLEVFQEDLNMIASLPMFANPQAILLCPIAKLLITYCISITKYLATLYQV
jgi:hypothetical protein